METLKTILNLLLEKNLVINLFVEIIFVGISFTFFQQIFKKQFSRKNTFIYITINSFCFILSNLFFNYITSCFLTFIASIVLFICLLKVSQTQTLVYFALQCILLLNVQFCIFQTICVILPNASTHEIIESPIFGISSILFMCILGLIVYIAVKRFNFEYSPINSNLITVISLLNLTIVFGIYNFFEIFSRNLLSILTVDLYFYASIINILYRCQILQAKHKIENLKLCNKTILNMYDETRAFKHDFHNIIQAIGGYVWTNDMEGLKHYYQEISNDCKNANNLSKLNPNVINNPAIYNILADKYYKAENHNIKINLDVMLDLNHLNIKIYELTRILGILLDNAIEASKECNEKNINVFFKQDKYKQILIIENTYLDKQLSIEKIFEKNYTTKPNNTGLGLWEVRKILNKNSNLNLHTSKNNDYFSQQLEIYTA